MTAPAVKPLAMRDAFLARIRDAMADDPDVFFVTADFGSPVIDDIRSRHPSRFINVGVAEQNLINVSAGLALEGFKVFAYAIAPFITMRCYEQIRVNLCLLSQVRSMNVTLIGVGAGYSYVVSGPTHQCYEDLSIMRTLPTVRVLSPSDHRRTADLFDLCGEPGIRYLRLDAQVLPLLPSENDAEPAQDVADAGFRTLRSDPAARAVLVSTGYMSHTAVETAEALRENGVATTVIDLVDLSAFDAAGLARRLRGAELVVSMEEGFTGRGGLDAVVQNLLRDETLPARFLPIGVRPGYNFELGSRKELHEDVGIGRNACIARISAALQG